MTQSKVYELVQLDFFLKGKAYVIYKKVTLLVQLHTTENKKVKKMHHVSEIKKLSRSHNTNKQTK